VARDTRPTWTIRRPLLIGILGVTAMIVLSGLWATRAQISGAIIGTGVIEVSTVRTAVQHPIGGVVVAIFKRDGDNVAAGDVILRLDDSALLSDLTVAESALFETLANIARLEAALDGRPEIVLDDLLAAAVQDSPEWQTLLGRLQSQLDDHFTAIETEMRLLDEQIAQTEAQIAGIAAQRVAAEAELAIVHAELARMQSLGDQGLIRATELSDLRTEEVRLQGDLGRFEANVAELRGRIAESEIQRLAVRTDAAELIQTELSKLRPERTRLLEMRAQILADLARLDIRAPVSGRIIGAQVYGLRSVVVAASPLMQIVPDQEPVIARVRVAATDVDQVSPGQPASLRFTAFNGRKTPVILGEVIQVSADSMQDARTLRFYYDVVVSLLPEEMAKLGDDDLIPGMPVEAFIATESRTPISYVMRPILVYFDRALRDA
jgi:HlyD family secretion protein